MYYLHKADETEAGEKLRNFLRQDSSDMLLLALHITSVIPPQPSSERARNHNAYPGAPIWRFCRVWLEHRIYLTKKMEVYTEDCHRES